MRKRVLVADDDLSIREALKKLLKEAGYRVSLAVNGEDALQQLKARETDLLVLDLEMPKRDGWDVLEELSLEPEAVPVLVITGRSDELETRIIPGSRGLLEKPVDAEVLLKRIDRLLTELVTKSEPESDAQTGAPPHGAGTREFSGSGPGHSRGT
jgi:DNA-binding response OmpR family regulator